MLNVRQGQRAEIRCTVTGNPTPAIEWIGMNSLCTTWRQLFFVSEQPYLCILLTFYNVYSLKTSALLGFNYMIVTGGPGNRMSPRAVIRNGILTFPAVDPADEGEYICKALNTHGEHTAQASLRVQSMLCVYTLDTGLSLFLCFTNISFL